MRQSSKARWARADDRDRFTEADRGQAEGMDGDGERLGESCFGERKLAGWEESWRRQVDKFAEKTRMVRVAEKAYVGAHVVMPAQTELAVIAVECGLKRPAVAHGESSDTGACFDDDARGSCPSSMG